LWLDPTGLGRQILLNVWPLSWLLKRRARAAEDMRDRYGFEAEKMARSFLNNADDAGNDQARRHWRAVRLELKRVISVKPKREDRPSLVD
jgi:hypothetical protein